MAKIMIECGNPNDFSEIIEAAERAAGSCTITYAKVAQEKIEAGQARSVLDAAKQIAPETGESVDAVRDKIRRGLRKIGEDHQQEQPTETTTETPQLEKLEKLKHGGARPGAGRKPKEEDDEEPESEVYSAPTSALIFATMAISQLERIRRDDPMKNEAFDKVISWIEKQRGN